MAGTRLGVFRVSRVGIRLGRSLALPGASPYQLIRTPGEILLLAFRVFLRLSRAKFKVQPIAFLPVP
jgi:hypothetical protein